MDFIYNRLWNTFFGWRSAKNNRSGVIHLYADYKISVKELRKQFNHILSTHPQWDGYTASIEVIEIKRNHTSLRILSGSNSRHVADEFQRDIREKMIAFINRRYPECLVKTRIEKTNLLMFRS